MNSKISMNEIKYIYANYDFDFKYYDAKSIAGSVEDNLFNDDDTLVQRMVGKFNIITIDEYYYIPKSAVCIKYKIDNTNKNRLLNKYKMIHMYRVLTDDKKVTMHSIGGPL